MLENIIVCLAFTTALQQDYQVARQYANEKVSAAYSYLPSPTGIFKTIADQIRGFFNLVGSSAYNILSSIGSILVNIWHAFTQRFYSIWSTIREWFFNIPNPLNYLPDFSSLSTGLVQKIRHIGSSIYGFIGDAFSATFHGIYTIFDTARQWIVSAVWNIYGYLPNPSNIIGKSAEKIKSFGSSIYAFLGNAFSSIYSLIYDSGFWIYSTVRNAFSSLYSLVYNGANWIYSSVCNTFSSLYSFARNGSSKVFNSLSTILWSIGTFVSDVLGATVQHVVNVFNFLRGWTANKISDAYNFLPQFSNFFNVISEQTRNFASYITAIFVNAYHSVTDWGISFYKNFSVCH